MTKKGATRDPGRQRGAALVVGLIVLAMLSLMGIAAYMVATQEERMSGNTRDRIRAFEAAEASLRDCESLLGGIFGTLPKFDGSKGMYKAPYLNEKQVYQTIDWRTDSAVRVIPTTIPDVAVQPRCIIEWLGELEVRRPSDGLGDPREIPIENVYRISAMGYGTNPSTTVNLQTMFRRQ